VARAAPDETESGGGLLVAAVQIAITLGAAGGGVLDTLSGVTGVFAVAGVITLATSAVVYARFSAAKPSRSWARSAGRSDLQVEAGRDDRVA
jgi:predicted MFS family arabinose efflux permease